MGFHSVESRADSSADESTEVSGESLLTDPSQSFPELVTRAGSKLYSVKKPRLERTGAGGGMDRVG